MRASPVLLGVLALPFALVFALLVFNLDPPLGPLEATLNGMAGQVVVVVLLLMEIAALVFAALAVVAGLRAGEGLFASPLHLVVAIAALAVLVTFGAAIAVDQYPCWIGVPNCD